MTTSGGEILTPEVGKAPPSGMVPLTVLEYCVSLHHSSHQTPSRTNTDRTSGVERPAEELRSPLSQTALLRPGDQIPHVGTQPPARQQRYSDKRGVHQPERSSTASSGPTAHPQWSMAEAWLKLGQLHGGEPGQRANPQWVGGDACQGAGNEGLRWAAGRRCTALR